MRFKYYTDMFAKMLDFKGESKLGEYWFCVLYNMIFSVLISLVGLPFVKDANLFLIVVEALAGIYNVIVFLPMLALTIRRLHDVNHSGLAVLLALIPIVGLIILVIYLATPSVQKSNTFDGLKNGVLVAHEENEYSFEEQTGLKDNSAAVKQPENKEIQDAQIVEKSQEKQTQHNTAKVESVAEISKPEENQIVAEQSKATKPRQRKSKISAPAKDKPLTRSQKIAELQQRQQNGEITEEEYHKQVMEILKH